MTPIAWLIIAAVVLPLAYFTWVLATVDRRGALAVQTNLSQGLNQSGPVAPAHPPAMLGIAKRFTPRGYEAKLDRWLALAGRPASIPLEKLIIGKPIFALGGVVLGVLLFRSSPTLQNIVIGLMITTLGYFLPDLLVYNKGIKRQELIQLEMPNTLDQMLISVEAGLGFEAAMARVAQHGEGPLAQELTRTLQDMQVGRPRQEAYAAMADRSSVAELRSFVRAVVQADKYGIGLAKVLRTQAKQSRVKRRQRAEEKAMKLPVKVLFPLMLFIFPVLFIVLLGPAAINIMRTLL